MFDGTEVRLYKNAQLIGQREWTFTNCPGDVRVPSRVSFSPPTEFFSGAFDEFTIWRGALTDSEIAAMYIPEPATMILLSLGGLLMLRRR